MGGSLPAPTSTTLIPDHAQPTRGPAYNALEETGLVDELLEGTITQDEAARRLGFSQGTISKALAAHKIDRAREQAEKERDERLALDRYGLLVDIYSMTDEELWGVVDYFGEWRRRHFRDPKNRPYTLPRHQRRWTHAILRAIRDGGNLLILSPPRHGKTELLIHLDAFLITRVNPNIRLVKVCKSEGLAKKAVGSVLDHLENNDSLIAETLGEGGTFKPTYGSRRPWNQLELVVATRNITGLKSPTLAAVGMGGTLLSRDGDVFTLDDVQDQQTVKTADTRESHRVWWANDFMSRKEDHTANIGIGSRQHPDDLWGYIADNPEWEVIIETAHDEAECQVEDPDNPENWDKHQDCMLWPEVRSYEWLMSIKNDPERAPTFSLVYLNQPQDAEVDVFTREGFDAVRDFNRVTVSDPQYAAQTNIPEAYEDEDGLYHPMRLIAGLDPSGSGYQASFLWAFDPAGNHLYAVDFENRLGGGVVPAREIVQRWLAWYGVRYWVIEENLYQGGIRKDEILQAYAQREGITLAPHETGVNKWDLNMGVSALAGVMKDGRMSIPWGDVQTQAKWSAYRKQLIVFSRDKARSKRTRSDIVMASWFPYETMLRWRREWLTEQAEQTQLGDDGYLFIPMSDVYAHTFGYGQVVGVG